jgi:hypothetical protein
MFDNRSGQLRGAAVGASSGGGAALPFADRAGATWRNKSMKLSKRGANVPFPFWLVISSTAISRRSFTEKL